MLDVGLPYTLCSSELSAVYPAWAALLGLYTELSFTTGLCPRLQLSTISVISDILRYSQIFSDILIYSQIKKGFQKVSRITSRGLTQLTQPTPSSLLLHSLSFLLRWLQLTAMGECLARQDEFWHAHHRSQKVDVK